MPGRTFHGGVSRNPTEPGPRDGAGWERGGRISLCDRRATLQTPSASRATEGFLLTLIVVLRQASGVWSRVGRSVEDYAAAEPNEAVTGGGRYRLDRLRRRFPRRASPPSSGPRRFRLRDSRAARPADRVARSLPASCTRLAPTGASSSPVFAGATEAGGEPQACGDPGGGAAARPGGAGRRTRGIRASGARRASCAR